MSLYEQLLLLLNATQPQVNEGDQGNNALHSIQRFPNGIGLLRETSTYVAAIPTPGASNTNATEPINLIINEIDRSNNLSYNAFDLDGFSTNAEGYFVLGNTDVANVSLVFNNNGLQNGADAIALYRADATAFPNSTALTLGNLIDAIVYDTNDANDTELLVLLNSGEVQINENEQGEGATQSLQRIPNGEGGVRNTNAYTQAIPTPGVANGGVIIEPEKLISILEARNTTEGTPVTITGVLTATDNFSGPAFIQDATGGIAVFDELIHGNGSFVIGDSITLTGVRAVFNDQVQISSVSNVENNGIPNNPIVPVTITLSELGAHPGELVRVVNTTFPNPGNLLFGNANFTLNDTSGNGELRIDNDVADVVGLAQPDQCAEIIGVVGRFREFFQLLPRNNADIPCAEEFTPGGNTSDIPRDQTLDIATWNIEWFGDEANSPAAGNPNSDAIQRDSVLTVIRGLDADIISVQEITDIPLFAELVNALEGYNFILSEGTSGSPNNPGAQRVGFIYKTAVISPISSRIMFTSIHPLYNSGDDSALVGYPDPSRSRFYASGRLPFLMTAEVTINGSREEIDFIALHARANSGSDAQSRYDQRRFDVEVLKDSLDANFATRKFIIAGDFNDDVDETVANVNTIESSYLEFVNDSTNYTIPTVALSNAGLRSFVFNDNVIDHILFSNELNETFVQNSSTVHFEFFDNDYSTTTSDHFPVSIRLQLTEELTVNSLTSIDISCNGASDGSASVDVAGGVAPFSYLWNTGETTATINNLTQGTYNVIITDANDNSILSNDVVVSEPETIIFNLTEDQQLFLGHDTIENITLTVGDIVGGTPEYSILWSTGESTESISVSPTETTLYRATVTDANGCFVTKEVTVTVEDIRCGNNPYRPRVTICFKGRSLCISKYAVDYFLRRGATLGSCDIDEEAPVVVKAKVFPNPVRNYTNVFLKVRTASNLIFRIYTKDGVLVNTLGAKVSKGINRIPLNVSFLPRGLYILKIIDAGDNVNGIRILKL